MLTRRRCNESLTPCAQVSAEGAPREERSISDVYFLALAAAKLLPTDRDDATSAPDASPAAPEGATDGAPEAPLTTEEVGSSPQEGKERSISDVYFLALAAAKLLPTDREEAMATPRTHPWRRPWPEPFRLFPLTFSSRPSEKSRDHDISIRIRRTISKGATSL